ncbi:DUF2066 domain-containing protein [Microvirga thermotolerans]|uniref:DUF2066 domain-containing protein n=1 Tax=Microvirga thermotolerans TaxID=2651334 RepID=A0A5P9JT05_9HYPH|nr:DUF2066 domain-containing protein [Microvirga thermotolerans]QFU15767.1 DUF2066 domain-containing protein [Microvirga thermotolerans]
MRPHSTRPHSMRLHSLRRHALAFALCLLAAAPAAARIAVEDLYRGQAITTGQMPENRGPAFARTFVDVLVKVSGDPALMEDPRVEKEAAQAASYVRAFRYRDRLEGKPIHDEQGTRDRPHDLTVDFDPPKIDAFLESLGRKPWDGNRPVLAVLLAVRIGGNDYVLAADAERGRDQRDAFAAASRRIGVPVVIPAEAVLAEGSVTAAALRGHGPSDPDAVARAAGADHPLVGTMDFSDADHGWVVTWRLRSGGRETTWQVRGVNFDEAFRNGLRGSARVLSGNGHP